MTARSASFRVGRVRAYLRGRVWYLAYQEQGRRRQPRVGPDRNAARQRAAEINGQLEAGAPSALSFQPISIRDLRQQWLDHHEHVRRSSLKTISRYRTATEHLLEFIKTVRPLARAADLQPQHAAEFVRFLRAKKVAPNGHQNTRRRPLRDAGIKYILETCCSLFNYAARNRHLPPYADNPFRVIEVSRIPIEDAKPIVVFTADQECRMLAACDDWQFPMFLTFLLTGLRPGELVHLLLPEDLDLEGGWLRVRNKPRLGWQIKTRNEREIPLVPVLVDVLRQALGERRTGPVFRERRYAAGHEPPLVRCTATDLERELVRRIARQDAKANEPLTRADRQTLATAIWRDIGALKEDAVRTEFKRLMKQIELPEITAPKTLRHTFATNLQDANVDPLIRSELMGHSLSGFATPGHGLGMTAVYTHTRPETKRRQLAAALDHRAAVAYAAGRLRAFTSQTGSEPDSPEANGVDARAQERLSGVDNPATPAS